MRRAKRYGIFFLVGASAYWLPDSLIQWLHPPHGIWMLLLTFGVPVIVGITWFALSRREPYRDYPFGFPLFMLLGIWALGPLAIAATVQLLGGKFLDPDQLQGFWLIWAAFPATTFVMATYSGSLGGLIITTLLLLVISIVAGLRHRVSKKAA